MKTAVSGNINLNEYEISKDLKEIVLNCTKIDPEQRYWDVNRLKDDIIYMKRGIYSSNNFFRHRGEISNPYVLYRRYETHNHGLKKRKLMEYTLADICICKNRILFANLSKCPHCGIKNKSRKFYLGYFIFFSMMIVTSVWLIYPSIVNRLHGILVTYDERGLYLTAILTYASLALFGSVFMIIRKLLIAFILPFIRSIIFAPKRCKHKFEGRCWCIKCGKLQPDGHEWERCRCLNCGHKRDEGHEWNKCKCTLCGITRDEGHEWVKSDFYEYEWEDEYTLPFIKKKGRTEEREVYECAICGKYKTYNMNDNNCCNNV